MFNYQSTLGTGTYYGVKSSGELVRVKDVDVMADKAVMVAGYIPGRHTCGNACDGSGGTGNCSGGTAS